MSEEETKDTDQEDFKPKKVKTRGDPVVKFEE